MATRLMVLERLAASAGMNPMTMERILRVQGVAGQIPSLGRGKRSGHFGAEAIKNAVLGAMAPSPGLAAEVAAELNALRFYPNALMGKVDVVNGTPVGISFGDYLKHIIERLSQPGQADVMMEDARFGRYNLPFEIVAQFDPTSVHVSRPIPGTKERLYEWFHSNNAPFTEPQPGIQHGSTLRLAVLIAAGELLADTLTNTSVPIPDPTPGSAGEGNAAPETTKATGPGSRDGLQSERSTSRAYPALAQTAPSTRRSLATGKEAINALPCSSP